ncbi:MAG TPA: NAD(P)/FAD-dependent oxidoreductase [Mycobacteriales bacterium]|jgi:phytoene dehydrogenase-like protein
MTVSARADAVVVGAGHNGLVAANLLADAGWSVLVVEQAPTPGGAVRSAEVTAPGFLSDLYSAFYPLGAASPVLRGLGLDAYGLRWSHAPAALAHVLPDGRAVLLSRDLDTTAASLDAFAPGDGDAWRDACAQWTRVREPLLDALFRPFPPVRPAVRLARALGVADGIRLARLGTMPVRRYGEEQFRGDGGRALLAGNAIHADLGPDNAGSAVFGWLLAMLAQDVGFPVPEGGAARLVEALVRRLTARGGRIVTGVRVTEVLVRDGRAHGVRSAAGDVALARRAVLADVTAPLLFRRLVGPEHLPARFVADLDRFEWDDATVKVDWALGAPIPWKAPEARLAGTLHLDHDVDGLTDYSADLATGRVPESPFLLLGQLTTADPARSPAGTESAWSYTHVPRGTVETDEELRAHVDRIEATVERHAPGFRDLIIGRHLQGPRDFQRHNPSLDDGAINGGTAAIHQQLVFRPVPGLGRPDTPVDRLFLAGSSAHPGGGVHGGPGSNAARAALARDRIGGRLYATGIRTALRAVYRD